MSRQTDAEALLADLLAAGAIPLVDGGRLRIDNPAGTLDRARRERLESCLPELRALVQSRYRSRHECVARRPCRRMSRCAEPVDGRYCRGSHACCLCGAPLSRGRRYLCERCTAEQWAKINAREGAR